MAWQEDREEEALEKAILFVNKIDGRTIEQNAAYAILSGFCAHLISSFSFNLNEVVRAWFII